MFMCRENGIDYYEKEVRSYRNKSKEKYPTEVINSYFELLRKMDGTLKKGRVYQDRKIVQQYRKEI